MPDSLLIAEITDLRTRLSEAEAETKSVKARFFDEIQANSRQYERLLDEEKRKREDAERAVDFATDLLDGQHEYDSCHCTAKHGKDCSECRTHKPGYRCAVQRAFDVLSAIIPTPEKKSQEKP